MRLIDADALKSYIDCGHLRPPTETCFSELDVVRMLDKQPTIDAEHVRHGRWLETESGVVICSKCGGGCNVAPMIAKRCLHCGAKMDGGAEDG